MTSPASARSRPDLKYLVAAGLLGFILGAFVVASLGNSAVRRGAGALAKPADSPDRRGDSTTPESPVVEVPAATSGRPA